MTRVAITALRNVIFLIGIAAAIVQIPVIIVVFMDPAATAFIQSDSFRFLLVELVAIIAVFLGYYANCTFECGVALELITVSRNGACEFSSALRGLDRLLALLHIRINRHRYFHVVR